MMVSIDSRGILTLRELGSRRLRQKVFRGCIGERRKWSIPGGRVEDVDDEEDEEVGDGGVEEEERGMSFFTH
ncbi:hypothetical protein HDU67_004799, partial [Dinochytrium kinnereticum]